MPITWDEVRGYAAGGSVGRPHIAQALIRAGLVGTTNEAFASRWLGARYFVPKADLDVFEAVRAVRAAGGVPVFAHPRATERGRVVPDRLIVELADAGLFGLEADHEDHSPAERAHVRALADEPRPGGHRIVRLPRYAQDGPAGRVHHRPRGVREDRVRGDRRACAGVTLAAPACATAAAPTLIG